jgi:hypothetical protein
MRVRLPDRYVGRGIVIGVVVTGGEVTGLVVGGFVTGGLVAGGLVTGGLVAGVVEAGMPFCGVVGIGVARGALVVVTIGACVVVAAGDCFFGGASVVDVFEDTTANAMPPINKTTTTGRMTLDHHGQRRSRSTDPCSGRGTRTAGRIAVCSSAGITGTGSVGSNSGGYHRPSA